MSKFLRNHVLTWDNFLHGLVAVAFTCLALPILLWLGPSAGRLGISLAWLPFPFAALAGVGLYLREASQVDWDFTLRWSAHKHLEWAVGTAAALLAAGVLALVQ